MKNIGCDIGKDYLDVFCNKNRKFKNNPEGIAEFIEFCLKQKDVRVVLEPSGGYERKLVEALFQNKIKLSLVNSFYVRNFARSFKDLAKTDRIDAKMLAEYGEKINPRLSKERDRVFYDLKELIDRRDVIVEDIKSENLRREKEPGKEIIKDILLHIEFLEERLACIEAQIKTILDANFQKEVEVLTSEGGIGIQTAAIIISNLPELGEINSREISKLVGLAPMAYESGKMKSARRIRGGRCRVRKALYMSSISAAHCNKKVKTFYNKLKLRGKPSKVALIAVAHKLLIILNAKMLRFRKKQKYF